ncbi:hypothetical protein O181_028088 [Austropuccinia psidii MF-1]|uniref:Uncharacterized protein n=1 Tax=Austropuccinia psidii MF-1 TaxID=1389203 RepID=A0A9Q3CQU6_9BASI|nr:hypothetical protein [Austropuccinia psidii MF-1]
MEFKHQKQNQLNSPQKYSPVPSIPCKQTPQQQTAGSSGTRWLEDLFCSEQTKISLLVSTFDLSELTLSPFVEPSHPNAPPIPCPSQSSEPHEDTMTCETEPEVAPMQYTEEPFDKSPLQFFLLFSTFPDPSFDHLRLVPLHLPP